MKAKGFKRKETVQIFKDLQQWLPIALQPFDLQEPIVSLLKGHSYLGQKFVLSLIEITFSRFQYSHLVQ